MKTVFTPQSRSWVQHLALGGAAVATLCLTGCGSTSEPYLPAAASALVPPEFTGSCPITRSSIERFNVKGSGLAFNGAQFGSIGTYTYTLAEATAEVSPADTCAATIVDLKNTVTDANGKLHYSFDVVLLSPTDSSKSNGTLFYEVSNRTTALLVPTLNDGSYNDLYTNVQPLVSATQTGTVAGSGAGTGFLMNQGASIVWAGWQGDRPQVLTGSTAAISNTQRWFAAGMTLPVAVDVAHANAPLTGTVQDELVADSATTNLLGTYYKMAPNSLGQATLTVRKTATSAPVTVAASLWSYTAGAGTAEGGNTGPNGFGFVTIDRAGVRADAAYASALDGGLDNGSIYQFNYTATNPKVMGLGFLATRDLVSFLRYSASDTAGNANPLAGRVQTTLFGGISQSGRFVRDYLWQG
ncbi:MAG: hypothetical protein ABI410_12020, partial [Rhodoferax sp.]